MHEEETLDDARFLTGSPQRPAILGRLCADAYRPTELTDEVDATRTTVQRILSGFTERDWVRKEDGRYRATATGQLVHDRYDHLLAGIDRADEVGPLARHLGDAADELPPELLTDAQVTVASDPQPLAAVDRLIAWFDSRETGHVRALSPVVAQSYNRAAAGLLERDVAVTLVIDQETLDRSLETFSDATERGLENERATIHVVADPLPFGLAVHDESTCLGAYDGENNLRGLLVSDSEAVREWALDTFEQYSEAATPLAQALEDDDLTGRGKGGR